MSSKLPFQIIIDKHTYFDFSDLAHMRKIGNNKTSVSLVSGFACYYRCEHVNDGFVTTSFDIWDEDPEYWKIRLCTHIKKIGQEDVEIVQDYISNGYNFNLNYDSLGIMTEMTLI